MRWAQARKRRLWAGTAGDSWAGLHICRFISISPEKSVVTLPPSEGHRDNCDGRC